MFDYLGCFNISSSTKKGSFENALVEKSKGSTRNSIGSVEGLYSLINLNIHFYRIF